MSQERFELRTQLDALDATTPETEKEFLRRLNGVTDSGNLEWIENATLNSHFFDCVLPPGLFAGKRVISVGAGPSVRDALPAIKYAAVVLGHTVICVDRIHKTLREAGIFPDFVIAADRSERIGEFLSDVDDFDSVIIKIVCDHEVVENVFPLARAFYMYATCNPYSSICEGFMKHYPSELFAGIDGFLVGFDAVQIPCWYGAKEVVLIGHDLSWPDQESVDEMYRSEIVITEHGAVTIPVFAQSAGVFMKFKAMCGDRIRIVNCSGGLLDDIELFESKTMGEYINEQCA